MKQYCQYCANAMPYGDSFCWCEEKDKMISDAASSKTNKCKLFEFNEMNVFNIDQIYKPKTEKHYKADDGQQESLF